MSYLIYSFVSPTGKRYVGQTGCLSRRLDAHKHSKGCTALASAFEKYGYDSFKLEILKSNLTKAEADTLECHYINYHNTLSPNGYNLKAGGASNIYTDSARMKMSLAAKSNAKNLKRLTDLGKNKSAATCKKISDASKVRWADPEYRKKMLLSFSKRPKPSKEVLMKMSLAQSGRKRTPEQVERMRVALSDADVVRRKSESMKISWQKRKALKTSEEF